MQQKKYTCTFENVAESALKTCCMVEVWVISPQMGLVWFNFGVQIGQHFLVIVSFCAETLREMDRAFQKWVGSLGLDKKSEL